MYQFNHRFTDHFSYNVSGWVSGTGRSLWYHSPSVLLFPLWASFGTRSDADCMLFPSILIQFPSYIRWFLKALEAIYPVVAFHWFCGYIWTVVLFYWHFAHDINLVNQCGRFLKKHGLMSSNFVDCICTLYRDLTSVGSLLFLVVLPFCFLPSRHLSWHTCLRRTQQSIWWWALCFSLKEEQAYTTIKLSVWLLQWVYVALG